tara:strand:- start:302 stop:1687 length:1386 start_codon:yes stop_codon:yes gene_type:complete
MLEPIFGQISAPDIRLTVQKSLGFAAILRVGVNSPMMKPLLFFIALLLTAPHLFSEDDYPLRDAVECHPRSGLPNVLAKLEAGEPVKVAYLGGSITAAAGWRVGSRTWLQEQYPDAEISEIHAAIGGTGSDLGVFRLGLDVLRHQPDLLFVEFAVNDGGAPPARIHKAMEGIVRQTWKANPDIDICYVYTLTDKMLPDLHAGKMPRAASAMEALADHYQIPSIHFGVEVAKLEAAGELVFKAPKPEDLETAKPMVFSSDGVHPHAQTGHKLYTEAIARSWPAIQKANSDPKPHPLPNPFREDNWERATQVPITPAMLSGNWEKLDPEHTLAKRFARNMPTIYQAKEAGASLTFSFNGTTAAVFDLLGPDGCEVSVQVDDETPAMKKRIDGYCTYHRMSKLNVASELEEATHAITVTVTPTALDKRSILFEKNRETYDKNPDRYADHTWYAASLLILGELIE